jgi:opacity protein-like surface antigen
MRKFLLASAAVAVMGGAAFAAEPLAPFAPPPPPVVEPFVVPSWAGPYIGADIGWGWADIGDNHFLFDNDFFDRRRHHNDDDDLDGVVGGVFAGWLGQRGTFLYGVEIFGQIADIDHDRDNGFFRDLFDNDDDFFVAGGDCFVERGGVTTEVSCPLFGRDVKVHALFGLEGMIGWGGERTALLLHAGPALGWFQRESGHVRSGDSDFDALFNTRGDDDHFELGLSVAAEGRFKLTENVFAGVIGRAFWFPDVGDDGHHVFRRHNDGDDVTVFEVKARLGMMFGQPPAAAPIEAAF